MFYDEIFAFTISPSCFASHLPLHKGGSSPLESTPIRYNTLYLAGKACEKEYEQKCSYSFCFAVGLNLLYGRHTLRCRERDRNLLLASTYLTEIPRSNESNRVLRERKTAVSRSCRTLQTKRAPLCAPAIKQVRK